jgi:hypothetical protein
MAVEMPRRRELTPVRPAWLEDYCVRVVDATVVCEPGSTGADWRVHYSLDLYGLQCDGFHLTGPKVGESFARFQVSPGDLMLGDRAYGHLKGFRHVLSHDGHFLTRLSRLHKTTYGLRGLKLLVVSYSCTRVRY